MATGLAIPRKFLEVLVRVQNNWLDLGLTSLVDQLGWVLSALLLRSYVMVIKNDTNICENTC